MKTILLLFRSSSAGTLRTGLCPRRETSPQSRLFTKLSCNSLHRYRRILKTLNPKKFQSVCVPNVDEHINTKLNLTFCSTRRGKPFAQELMRRNVQKQHKPVQTSNSLKLGDGTIPGGNYSTPINTISAIPKFHTPVVGGNKFVPSTALKSPQESTTGGISSPLAIKSHTFMAAPTDEQASFVVDTNDAQENDDEEADEHSQLLLATAGNNNRETINNKILLNSSGAIGKAAANFLHHPNDSIV